MYAIRSYYAGDDVPDAPGLAADRRAAHRHHHRRILEGALGSVFQRFREKQAQGDPEAERDHHCCNPIRVGRGSEPNRAHHHRAMREPDLVWLRTRQ